MTIKGPIDRFRNSRHVYYNPRQIDISEKTHAKVDAAFTRQQIMLCEIYDFLRSISLKSEKPIVTGGDERFEGTFYKYLQGISDVIRTRGMRVNRAIANGEMLKRYAIVATITKADPPKYAYLNIQPESLARFYSDMAASGLAEKFSEFKSKLTFDEISALGLHSVTLLNGCFSKDFQQIADTIRARMQVLGQDKAEPPQRGL